MPEIVNLLLSIVLGLAILIGLLYLANFRPYTVLEHERGLIYRNGRFQRVLHPGRHWYNRLVHTIYTLDVRARFVSIPGQEVMSSDNVSLKVSLAANFKVVDPYRAINQTASYQDSLYAFLQLALRDLVGATPIDELLARRKEIGDLLFENTRAKATELGIELLSVGIKDIMFPGELKSIFAQVVSARKEGLAALERARGESAALRNLANTAKLLENNPALLQLRLLQALSSSSGNTIMLRLPDDSSDVPPPKRTGSQETDVAQRAE